MSDPAFYFDGYHRYKGGGMFRRWLVVKRIPELAVEEGWWIFGGEPDEDGELSFHLRRPDQSTDGIRNLEPYHVAALFGPKGPPPWDRERATREPQTPGEPGWSELEHHLDECLRIALRLRLNLSKYSATGFRTIDNSPAAREQRSREYGERLKLEAADALASLKPEHWRIRENIVWEDPSCPSGAVVLLRDVPQIGANEGDVLLPQIFEGLAWIPGRTRELGLDDYAALREVWSDDVALELYPEGWALIGMFVRDRNKWGARLKVFRSRLLLVKPLARELVSEPIRAADDLGAIVSLLADVGGRMPRASQ